MDDDDAWAHGLPHEDMACAVRAHAFPIVFPHLVQPSPCIRPRQPQLPLLLRLGLSLRHHHHLYRRGGRRCRLAAAAARLELPGSKRRRVDEDPDRLCLLRCGGGMTGRLVHQGGVLQTELFLILQLQSGFSTSSLQKKVTVLQAIEYYLQGGERVLGVHRGW